MFRATIWAVTLSFIFGFNVASAQSKKTPSAAKVPPATENAISVTVYLSDDRKNEILLGTRIWPGFPDYNALSLQRFFAVMKALEPTYKQNDEVAYTWSTKGKVAKCSIYLESVQAGVKNGTGATVGCEDNSVSSVAVTASADPKRGVSSSDDPKHIADVLELFKKQSERAKSSLPKQ